MTTEDQIKPRLVMRPGLKVWTKTTSGEPIICTAMEADWLIDGEWLLNSPAHGYAIQRHYTECEEYKPLCLT